MLLWSATAAQAHGLMLFADVELVQFRGPGSIFSDFNVCFDFPLIHVAIALNTRKTEH